jgi:hypothetical protein
MVGVKPAKAYPTGPKRPEPESPLWLSDLLTVGTGGSELVSSPLRIGLPADRVKESYSRADPDKEAR